MTAYSPLAHAESKLLEDKVVQDIAKETGRPAAQVFMSHVCAGTTETQSDQSSRRFPEKGRRRFQMIASISKSFVGQAFLPCSCLGPALQHSSAKCQFSLGFSWSFLVTCGGNLCDSAAIVQDPCESMHQHAGSS